MVKQFGLRIGMLACICIFASVSLGLAAPAGEVIPGRYIVELKKNAAPAKVIAAHGIAADFVYTSAVKGFAGFIPPGQLKKLQQDPAVTSIVPDRVMQASVAVVLGKPSKPGPGPAPGQVVPEGIKRVGADPANGGSTGAGVGVAIVDTGLDFAHPDLTVGASSYSAYGDHSSAQDDEGHGTHVGGIVAAQNNDIGVVGVAPGATLYAVKVLDKQGYGSDSTIMAGLNWVSAYAVTNNIRVVNMSLGRPGTLDDNPLLHEAVIALYSAGIAVVVAAGNDRSLEVKQQVPATYPEVLAIASTTAKDGTAGGRYSTIQADTASYFTSDGKFDTKTGIGVTVSAPGEDQENVSKSGMITSVGILSTKLGGGTVRMSGTSMAAPHVTGILARYFASHPAATGIEKVRGQLMLNAQRLTVAPLDSPARGYSYDGEREGIAAVLP